MGSLGKLEPGASRFWNGPMVPSSGLAAPGAVGAAVCEHEAYECFAYELEVGSGGSRLRVAIDHPYLSDISGLELRSPDGTTVSVATGWTADGAGTYSAEAFVPEPAAGAWRVVAIAHTVSASAFRMRARLEGARPPASGPVRDLLPNLQANPPSRIGFAGCQASEASRHGATRCLRFAQGPQNVGEGPLILHVRDPGMTGPQYQVIERSDGSSYEVPAGEFEYHLEHRHYHHSAVGRFELYRVADPQAGVLEPAGTGPKQGFCMDDYFIAH